MEEGYISPEQEKLIAEHYANEQKLKFWATCLLGVIVTGLLIALIFAPH